MGKHIFTVVVAVVIGISLLLYLFSYQVRTNEVALVLTFGKAADKASPPGWHAQWPWPIQEVRLFDNRLHVREGLLEEAYTKDKYNIITSLCVGWKIGDVEEFNRNFGGTKDPIEQAWVKLEKIIRDKSYAVMGRHLLTDLVNVDPAKLKYDDIESQALEEAARVALKTYGIEVALLRIKRLELPDSVKAKVYDRMKEERNTEADGIRRQGEAEASAIRAKAEAQGKEIKARAKREAQRLRGEADAVASQYYEEFKKHPELAVFLRKVRAIREVTKKHTTIILDADRLPFDLFGATPGELEGK